MVLAADASLVHLLTGTTNQCRGVMTSSLVAVQQPGLIGQMLLWEKLEQLGH